MRKKSDRESLQRVLWYTVLWIFVIFYAFVAGVWAGEQEAAEKELHDAPVIVIEAGKTGNPSVTCGDSSLSTREPSRAVEDAGPCAPDVCEDTYLIEEHPLDFETQMLLYGACLEFNVDYQLVLAMMDQETDFRNIMGDGGDSYGYLQVQRKWHEDRMAELGVTDLMDPESNFRVACSFLRECLDRYGNLEDALSYYNSGEPGGNVYSREVLGRMQNG